MVRSTDSIQSGGMGLNTNLKTCKSTSIKYRSQARNSIYYNSGSFVSFVGFCASSSVSIGPNNLIAAPTF